MGPKTKKAIAEFQASVNLLPPGKLSNEVLKALAIDRGKFRQRPTHECPISKDFTVVLDND